MEGVCELIDGGYFRCTPTWRRETPVIADCHRCYFPLRGRADVIAGSERCELRPGSVFLIPGQQPLSYHCPRSLTLNWVHFRMLAPDLEAALNERRGVVTWNAGRWAFFKPTYSAIEQTLSHRRRRNLEQLQSMLLFFVAELVGDQLDRFRQDPGGWIERLRPALEFMERHFRSNPPLEEVARKVNLSPVYFHRQFRRVMGVTPHAYMLRRRMQLARQRIERSHDPIKVAADAAGYDNIYYFSRAFKRYYGVSPSHIRRLSRPEP